MKNNQVTFILVGIFLLCTVAAAFLGQKYNSTVNELSEKSVEWAKMQNSPTFIDGVYRAALEYGKTNPAIMPLLPTPANAPAAPKASPK